MFLKYLLLNLLYSYAYTNGECFTSTSPPENLPHIEDLVSSFLENFIEEDEESLEQLHKYADNSDVELKASVFFEAIGANTDVVSIINSSFIAVENFTVSITDILKTDDDMVGLMPLQDMLETTACSNERFDVVKNSFAFSAADYFDLGEQAYCNRQQNETNLSVNRMDILEYYYSYANIANDKRGTNQIMSIHPGVLQMFYTFNYKVLEPKFKKFKTDNNGKVVTTADDQKCDETSKLLNPEKNEKDVQNYMTNKERNQLLQFYN